MSTRFSFDVGTNSIGWAVFEVQEGSPVALKNTGVRVFSNSRADKTYTPLNQERQIARSARRRRDRYLQRREHVLSLLSHYKFFPIEKEQRLTLQQENPYELRAKALDTALSAHQIGRALFHINQRRGFKSNRLQGGDDESGKIKPVIEKIAKELQQNKKRTLGEYLYDRFKKKQPVRAKAKTPGKTDYDLYFSRKMYEEEFDKIWETQKKLHSSPDLFSDEAYEKIKEVIFYQRKLKAQTPGKCTLEENEYRCAWALPIAQEFRMLQDLNNIHIYHNRKKYPLEIPLRDTLEEWLEHKSSSVKPEDFNTKIKKEHNLEGSVTTNFEGINTKNFKNNETTKVLSKVVGKQTWQSWDRDTKNDFVETLLNPENDDSALHDKLCKEWNLEEAVVQKCIDAIATLPKGYCNLSRKALSKIVLCLRKEIITYDKAVQKAGYEDHRISFENGHKQLPYYGEILSRYCIGENEKLAEQLTGRKQKEAQYGKITNPTVHVGLNQLQKVVNELIRRYGKPQEIVLELLRDFSMGKETKSEYEKRQRENKANNERIRKILKEECGIIRPSREDREKYRLWEELDSDPNNRRCPYSNKKITREEVCSRATDVDHILPFSRTLDNSFANKVLCKSGANKEKTNKTPYEAWGNTDRWKDILNNVKNLPHNKRWRFQKDAMERFEEDEKGFLAHQLHSSQYFAKVARYYLECLKEDSHSVDIWVIPGKLTAWLRSYWGLNTVLGNRGADTYKNRDDHRNHAVDAVVVGCTERGILNRIADWATSNEEADAKEFSRKHRDEIPSPWEGFREDIERSMEQVIVSHKSDRGRTGQLLEEQAYSFKVSLPETEKETKEKSKVRYVGIHKSILDLTFPMIKKIASPKTRELLNSYIHKNDGDIKKALQQCFEEESIRRIKIISKETVIAIKDTQGAEYKGYASAGNWAYEIYEDENGKWQGEMITRYQANQKNYIPAWRKKYPTKKMLMRLHNNDTVMIHPPDAPEGILYRVCKMSGNINMYLSELYEANDASRANEIKDNGKTVREQYASLSKLQEYKLTKVHISPTGMCSFARK